MRVTRQEVEVMTLQEAMLAMIGTIRTSASINREDLPWTGIWDVGDTIRYVLIIRLGHDQDYNSRLEYSISEHHYDDNGGIPKRSYDHAENAPSSVALQKLQALLNAHEKIERMTSREKLRQATAELPQEYGQW